MEDQATQRDGPASATVAISNAIVQLYRTHFGRGPTKARVVWQGDVVTVLLEDVLTTAERTLVEAGHVNQVVEQRMILQYAMADQFTGAVEESTGRKVRLFVSGVNAEAASATEVFALQPDPSADGALA